MFEYKSQFEWDNGLRIPLSKDFVLYYKWFIDKYFFNTMKLFIPRHGAHVSVLLPCFHSAVIPEAKKFHGKPTTIYYDPSTIYWGGGNRFNGFYMDGIHCPDSIEIRKELGLPADGKNFKGYHITICTDKHKIK